MGLLSPPCRATGQGVPRALSMADVIISKVHEGILALHHVTLQGRVFPVGSAAPALSRQLPAHNPWLQPLHVPLERHSKTGRRCMTCGRPGLP